MVPPTSKKPLTSTPKPRKSSSSKRARLVSTTLDRAFPNSRTKKYTSARTGGRNPRNFSAKTPYRSGQNRGYAQNWKGGKNWKGKNPGNEKGYFPFNPYSNFDRNQKVRRANKRGYKHLGFRKQTFRIVAYQLPRSRRSSRLSRLRAQAAASSKVKATMPIYRRVVARFFRPRTIRGYNQLRVKLTKRLRAVTSFRPLRRFLAEAARLRGWRLGQFAGVARSAQWTPARLTKALFVVDRRFEDVQFRSKGRPVRGLTFTRVKIARQLIRKFRATRGVKHSALRRRLQKFHWSNKKFLKSLKYPRRRRVLGRLTRRADRYLQTSLAVLTAAHRRHKLLRGISRRYRERTQLATRALQYLTSGVQTESTSGNLSQRHRLFSRLQYLKRTRAGNLISAREHYLSSFYSPKATYSWLQRRTAARRLRRRLGFRTLPSRLSKQRAAYRSSGLLQRRTVQRDSKWLELRRQRYLVSPSSHEQYLTAPIFAVNAYTRNRRLRHMARQRQQLVRTELGAKSVLPKTLRARYLGLNRRLQFKKLASVSGDSAVTPFGVTTPKGVIGLTEGVAVWQGAALPEISGRFQLPTFARNATLRARSQAFALRARSAISTKTGQYRTTSFAAATRATSVALRAQRTQLVEARCYRRRAKLRLPRTIVRRFAALRTDAKLFTRHTLKKPQTWQGMRKLLLPVSGSYTPRARHVSPSVITQTDLRPVRRAADGYPRVWTRPTGYHEAMRVYAVRNKKRVSMIRNALRVHRVRARKTKLSTLKASSTATRLSTLLTKLALSPAGTPKNPTLKRALFAKLELQRGAALRGIQHAKRRAAGRVSSEAKHSHLGRTTLQLTRASSAAKKQKALWHLRSVQQMLAAERSLSAWSPQYPTRWRRWSSPRAYGLPMSRQWPSRKLQRQQYMLNVVLTRHGRPKRKYFDRAYGHLLFHRGSAATIGYERFRRTQRVRSKNNRWWKPTTYPVPFTNPYSRRSINAKKHTVRRLARQHTARGGEVGTGARGMRGVWYPVATPPRLISSRALRYSRRHYEGPKQFEARVKLERAKLPPTLQRWSVRTAKYRLGTNAAPRKTTTLTRRKRTIRRLEGLFPRSAVWTDRRWQKLDAAGTVGSAAALYAEACQKLPVLLCERLLARFKTPAAALNARKAIFAGFCNWYKLNTTAGLSAPAAVRAAARYIISEVDSLQADYQQSEINSYTRLAATKKDRFWQLRELPRLRGKAKNQPASLFDKANTRLYKHWLHGAERYLKRGRTLSLPPRHRRGGSGLMTDYGRTRRRFPATGLRRHSYDSMLHAFIRRAGPSRFRRLSTIRFQRLRAPVLHGYRHNLNTYDASRALRRHRLLALKLGHTAYVSPAWRELLSYRDESPLLLPGVGSSDQSQVLAHPSGYAQPLATIGKRRFTSLPTKLFFTRALAARTENRAKSLLTLRTQRAGLLRYALRHRRFERLYVDLKKHISRRRLPKEKKPAPWRRKRRTNRREQHALFGDWSARHFNAEKSRDVFWTLHQLEDYVSRRRDRVKVLATSTPINEPLSLSTVELNKPNWAKQGFRIKLPQYKPYRYSKLERKRRRRGRSRVKKGRQPSFRHFTERRNYEEVSAISGKRLRGKMYGLKDKAAKLVQAKARLVARIKTSLRLSRRTLRAYAWVKEEHFIPRTTRKPRKTSSALAKARRNRRRALGRKKTIRTMKKRSKRATKKSPKRVAKKAPKSTAKKSTKKRAHSKMRKVLRKVQKTVTARSKNPKEVQMKKISAYKLKTVAAKKVKVTRVLKMHRATKLASAEVLSARSLTKYSSARLPKRLAPLYRRTLHRRNKFTRRSFATLRRALRRKVTNCNLIAEAREQARRTILPYVTAATVSSVGATPLLFQRPTKMVVKSEAEKKRAVIWNIQSKELRYKRTAQYADALTTFIPALISFMIARRAKTQNIPYKTAKTLVAATYWNLRVYLNVDPFEKRLELRDNNFTLLRTLGQEVDVLAKEQITEHVDRIRLRERFQPCKLHPAPVSDRFRLDWLRAFFPRRHALFQEDSEEFAAVALSTDQVRRTVPSGYGIASSRTSPVPTHPERTHRRLMRLRLSHSSRRFETMLQTVSRPALSEVDSLFPFNEEGVFEAPTIEPLSAAVKAKLKKGEAAQRFADAFAAANLTYVYNEHSPAQWGLSTHRTPFFSRNFSTQTTRTLSAVLKHIDRRQRLATSYLNKPPLFAAVAARYRLKTRTSGRGRTNYASVGRGTMTVGGLDPRFLRYKSPRSRQYILRMPASVSRRSYEEKLIKLLEFRALHERREGTTGYRSRLSRRFFYKEAPSTPTPLAAVRALVTARRTPFYLQEQLPAIRQAAVNHEYYHFPNRRQFAFTPADLHAADAVTRKKAEALIPAPVASTYRSILQFRSAAQRTVEHVYKPEVVIRKRPVLINRRGRRAGRAGVRAVALLRKIDARCAFHNEQLEKTEGDTKAAHQFMLDRTIRVFTRVQNRLRVLRDNRPYPAKEWGASGAYPILRYTRGGAANFYSRRLSSVVNRTSYSPARYFTPRYLRLRGKLQCFTKKCMRLQKARRVALFDTYRPKLWYKLTNRWRKKDRLLRNWIKVVSRWFRDPWLSQTVDLTRPSAKRLLPGEIRSREQQAGELVIGNENRGFTKEESAALQKAALPAIAAARDAIKADRKRATLASKRARGMQKKVIRVRRATSRQALHVARPTLRLANMQARQKAAELALWRTKSRKEKDAIRLAEKEAAIARAKEGLPPLPAKKAPLKMPANHWIPLSVWKDVRRRARRLEWRESDDVFYRRGFRNAFRFYPTERNRAPWLESLMYNRSLFSTRLREFRRRQFPKEQKKYKWLQRVRKSLFPGRTNVYIRGRRWPRLRMYNQRLHYTLFNLPDRSAARRHFKKLSRRSCRGGFARSQEGLSNRLDNVLIHLNMAPTIFWSRVVAPFGLLRVNGKIVTDLDFRFKAGDFIEPVWERVHNFRHYFEAPLNRNDEPKRAKRFSPTGVPRNFRYYPGIHCYTYLGNPKEGDLRKSSRLQPHLFRWFRLDSV